MIVIFYMFYQLTFRETSSISVYQMDNKLRPAQGGSSMVATRLKTAEYRQMIVKKIMDYLSEFGRRTSAFHPSDVKKMAESLEEKSHAAAKDEIDYHAKVKGNVNTLVASYRSLNRKVLNSKSSSREVEASVAKVDWQEEIYQRVKRIKRTNSLFLTELYQFICTKYASYHQRNLTQTAQPLLTIKLDTCKRMKQLLEEIFVQLSVTKTQITPSLTKKLDTVEKLIKKFENDNSFLQGEKHSLNSQPKLQLDSSQARNPQGESSELKPNLQGMMNLQGSHFRMPQSCQQYMMHLQGPSAKLVKVGREQAQEQSDALMHQVAKESISSKMQQNQLPSKKGPSEKLVKLEQEQSDILMHQEAKESISSEMQQNQLFGMEGDSSEDSCVVIGSPAYSLSLFLEECCNEDEVSGDFCGDTGKHALENFSSSSCEGNTVEEQTSDALKSDLPYLTDTELLSVLNLLQDWCNPNEVSQNSTVCSNDASPAIQLLVSAVTNASSEALHGAVGEMRDAVCLNDIMAMSAPERGSKGAIGRDLGADTNARFQQIYYGHQGLVPNTRTFNAVPLDTARINASTEYSLKCNTKEETSDLISDTSQVKRSKKCALLEEIREINRRLIDVEVVMSTTAPAGAAKHGDGFFVKCIFRGISINWNDMPQMMIEPLQLLIPTDYPAISPIFLDELPVQVSKDVEDFSIKARSKLSFYLRTQNIPFSLRLIAKLWESCAREVIIEFARPIGGGTFSSKYGGWSNML
ncbi:hypothetical protein L6164_023190 [Bauhinia variegata]|uniref:Uncharacterized protein n=1 Tax=Bauhinia variegata TaxID=167791 RepID=A0ACB9MJ00_BAUVA|nr:hypothetical protein L6164_023190 [Bauhinia variegata]